MNMPRCCFIVWNPFQVVQFANLATRFDQAPYIVIEMPGNEGFFDDPYVSSSKFQFVRIRPEEVEALDTAFDLVFFQSPFPNQERLTQARLIAVQYGLAKERHNYGEWRSLADLNFTYGDYSRERIEHFAPAISVGNPKFDAWPEYESGMVPAVDDLQSTLDSSKPTLLFMPTWGGLGSFHILLPELARLQSTYNILIKIHHNDAHRDVPAWRSEASSFGLTHLFEGSADQLTLLRVADLVISDFSGAIFDAIFARVPVVLFQETADERVGVQKFDLDSIEFSQRDMLGVVCEQPRQLSERIEWTLAHREAVLARCSSIRERLFHVSDKPAGQLIHEGSMRLWRGEIPPLTPAQRYIRDAVREVRRLRKRRAMLTRAPQHASQGVHISSTAGAFTLGFMMLALPQHLERKLVRDPAAFFGDSKHRVVRAIGERLGYL